MTITESNVERLNRLFIAELGNDPPTAWIWSEHLVYLKSKYDTDGTPVYETRTHGYLLVKVQAREKAKMFPELENQWVACYLEKFPESDTGALNGTGDYAWVPISNGTTHLCLDPDQVPTREITLAICQQVRHSRKMLRAKLDAEEEKMRPSVPVDETMRGDKFERLVTVDEKKNYDKVLDIIKDTNTAFCSIPGEKAHVSFPSAIQEKNDAPTGD